MFASTNYLSISVIFTILAINSASGLKCYGPANNTLTCSDLEARSANNFFRALNNTQNITESNNFYCLKYSNAGQNYSGCMFDTLQPCNTTRYPRPNNTGAYLCRTCSKDLCNFATQPAVAMGTLLLSIIAAFAFSESV